MIIRVCIIIITVKIYHCQIHCRNFYPPPPRLLPPPLPPVLFLLIIIYFLYINVVIIIIIMMAIISSSGSFSLFILSEKIKPITVRKNH